MTRRIYSVRNQLLVWLVVPSIALWVLGGFGAYLITKGLTQSTYDDALEDSARIVASRVKVDSEAKLSLDMSPEALRILRADPHDIIYVQVRSADGTIVAGDADLPPAPPPPPGGHQSVFFHDGRLHGQDIRVCVLNFIPDHSQPNRPVTVQIAETLGSRAIIITNTIETIAPVLVLIMIAAGLSVWFGVGRGLAQLEQVRETVASRSYFDLEQINEANSPIEVRPLIREINSLLKRLAEGKELHQRFIENAAHQMRTPLAGLKANLQLALRDPAAAQAIPNLAEISSGLDRVTRLVSQLLTLARAQPGAIEIQQRTVDLELLVKEVARELVPQAGRKQIDLGFEGAGKEVRIHGDAVALRDLVTNLIDNAVRYTPSGGSVTARVSAEAPVRFMVEDSGPGIPENEIGLVFERFYRGHGVRTEGTGLGLAIVQEIALRHGAVVTLTNRPAVNGTKPNGVIATVTFPAL